MSDDWAEKYIDIHKKKQQEKGDAQERGRLARAGAPSVFQRIKDRIRQDLKTFRDASVFQSLSFNDVSAVSFSVDDTRYPVDRPTLRVELESIVVKYHHLFPPKGSEESSCRNTGTLRICSDLSGITQVYQNNSREAFTNESDISEFLLKPLLDFLGS